MGHSRFRHYWLIAAAVIVICLGLMTLPQTRVNAIGRGVQVISLEQSDLDGDGRVDVTTINCQLVTGYYPGQPYPKAEPILTESEVCVYDAGGDMVWSEDWKEATDFANDTWVFDIGGSGTAELVIVFGEEDGQQVAYLYDDRDGDSDVEYRITGTQIEILESEHWSLKVASSPTWALPDGSLNLNLTFWVDGFTWLYGGQDPEPVQALMPHDGIVDWETTVLDSDQDGIPEYQLRRRLTRTPVWYHVHQAGLRVNAGEHRPREYEDFAFWPFLVAAHGKEPYNYFDFIPAVFVNWQDASVFGVGVIGYPIEKGYHINNWRFWEINKQNEVSFENPMAYYDLANDQDGRPELHVRLETFSAADPFFLSGSFPRPMVMVDYSWDQDNNTTWDHKVSLVGFHSVDFYLALPHLSIRTVPYRNIPQWVNERAWAAAVFLVAEDGGFWTSEGLYGWNLIQGFRNGEDVTPSGLRNLYLTGLSDRPPVQNYSAIRAGHRGEYCFELGERPFLYFSPYDRKLHLLWAQAGVWNVDGLAEVRYANLDEDAYLDEWKYLDGGVLRRQLDSSGSYLIYAGDGKVMLKRVDVAPSLFETMPPRNHEEWIVLGQRLEENQRDFEPGAFEAMVAQFPGVATEIEGASMRDFRLTDRGFRFVLELGGGFHIPSDPVNWRAVLRKPGAYVVAYDGERLSVRPLTPASLNVSQFHIGERDGSVREQEWAPVQVVLQNDGLEDVYDLLLCTSFDGPQGQTEVLTMTVELVPGQASQEVVWDWLPSAEGAWEARVETGCHTATKDQVPHQVLARLLVDVQRRPAPPIGWLLSLGERAPLGAVVLFVSVTGLAASAAALWTLYMRGEERPERPNS